jgi:hypothetical protein
VPTTSPKLPPTPGAACIATSPPNPSPALRASRGGRNLIDTGQENDIDLAAHIDKFDVVPVLDLATWRIRV